jgi:hypothetical protein
MHLTCALKAPNRLVLTSVFPRHVHMNCTHKHASIKSRKFSGIFFKRSNSLELHLYFLVTLSSCYYSPKTTNSVSFNSLFM